MALAVTQEELKSLFSYTEDGGLIRISTGKKIVASKSGNHRYLRISVQGKPEYLHRVIYLLKYGDLPPVIDHIDGDRFNNRIDNLRAATQSENCLNARRKSTNRSGFKNVYWDKGMSKYAVTLTVDRERKTLGYFDDVLIANQVARNARQKHHKSFCNHGGVL